MFTVWLLSHSQETDQILTKDTYGQTTKTQLSETVINTLEYLSKMMLDMRVINATTETTMAIKNMFSFDEQLGTGSSEGQKNTSTCHCSPHKTCFSVFFMCLVIHLIFLLSETTFHQHSKLNFSVTQPCCENSPQMIPLLQKIKSLFGIKKDVKRKIRWT